ncbi:transporter [Sphingomonas sp. 28-63-12]|uniref:transporter n=1 Tax=Sphingomonas sp. 28-63-12 TaxID=1970434 RepID=UPI000BD41B3E|nr:MAG: hypothetical protein B7Y47_15095 [Sphingomonas sp. 28-63-12]
MKHSPILRLGWIILLIAVAVAQPARARDFCPDRPGIDTPPCTVEPGHLTAEMSFADWTHEATPDDITDSYLIGDLLLRYGIAEHAELRVGWTPFERNRTRDRQAGTIDSASGTGDVTLGIKRNLIDPDGKAVSVALLPSVILPTGGSAIGAGDWGAGLQVPLSMPINDLISVALTPEVDAAVNQSGHGRHFAYGTAGGVSIAPMNGVTLAIEAAVLRDDDPDGASTQAIAGAAMGIMVGRNAQLDVGSEFGLNRDAPDVHLYIGIARRF